MMQLKSFTKNVNKAEYILLSSLEKKQAKYAYSVKEDSNESCAIFARVKVLESKVDGPSITV